MSFLRRNLKIVIPVVVVVTAGLAWLAFGYFGVQFLFIDDKVDEAGPVFTSGAVAGEVVDDDQTAPEPESTTVEPTPAPESPAETTTEPPPPDDAATDDEPAEAAPTIETVVAGQFIDRAHPTSGVASVLTDGSSQRFLRLEDFETDNGPDLNVYLVAAGADDDEGLFDDDFVDLGNLKGNIGSQNYEIDPDVDLERYDTVVIWCVRFSVAFGAADLT